MADATFGKGHHLHLIDGSAYIFRAYHALPPLTRKSDGLPVGAVAGFCNILWNELSTDGVERQGRDPPGRRLRLFGRDLPQHLYPEYKANRPDLPEDLRPQFPLTREATRAFNVACLETEGYEADDIIATLAVRRAMQAGGCTIISSDKDLMQLVGPGVDMFDPMKTKTIGPDEVMEKFGVPPDKVIDVQSLAGDSVDNVPGAPGIGLKTAALLINEYGDLDTLLARADEIKQPKRREALIENADQIRLSRELVTLEGRHAARRDAGRAGNPTCPNPTRLMDFLTADGVPHSDPPRGRQAGHRSPGDAGNLAAAGRDAEKPTPRRNRPPLDHAAYECIRDVAALQPLDRPDPRERLCRRRHRNDQSSTRCRPSWSASRCASMRARPPTSRWATRTGGGDLFGATTLAEGQMPLDEALAAAETGARGRRRSSRSART